MEVGNISVSVRAEAATAFVVARVGVAVGVAAGARVATRVGVEVGTVVAVSVGSDVAVASAAATISGATVGAGAVIAAFAALSKAIAAPIPSFAGAASVVVAPTARIGTAWGVAVPARRGSSVVASVSMRLKTVCKLVRRILPSPAIPTIKVSNITARKRIAALNPIWARRWGRTSLPQVGHIFNAVDTVAPQKLQRISSDSVEYS